jgi:RNA polymerase sigma-70 factor (ECF subfamily)
MAQSQLVNELLENRDAMLGFIMALTRDHAVAEEIFQDVAKAILEEANQGRAVAQFMPWAREIARRRVSEFYRRNAQRRQIESISPSMEEVVCQAFAENEKTLEASQARLQALLECLEGLSGPNRQAVEGLYRQRKSVRDIAGALGWSEQSVKNALWRSRKTLAECIRRKVRAQQTS